MRRLSIAIVLALAAAACTGDTGAADSTTTPAPPSSTTAATTVPSSTTTTTMPAEPLDPDGLYLMLMWHQHQPLYPKDADGVVTRPWVRAHAAKDYYDMAALVEEYPGVQVTFNLTPVLMRQLEEIAAGVTDRYWELTARPADGLSAEEAQFVVDRFFDTNPRVIARFPRYQELADRRGEPFTPQDLRDLQVLWNLAWTDPTFLATEPLASLVARGRDFTEADKAVVLDEHRRITAAVLGLHARLWEEGHIEVATSPLAHPILPLVTDTDLAAVGDSTALLPDEPFRQPVDAAEHVRRGLAEAGRLLGAVPAGMWPGEGAVAQRVIPLFAREGVQWIASGEDVLAPSLGIGAFTRDGSDTVQEADLLYRPWLGVPDRSPPVAMFFRDRVLSDLIGFQYSGTPAEEAADDFMARLAAIRDRLAEQGAEGPHVVSVILDGENAWEHYPGDGADFLRALYGRLEEADFVRTITPSRYLEAFGEGVEALDEVHPGAWFSSDYSTWIGEVEEKTAWDYLGRAREDLARAERSGDVAAGDLAAAYESMLYAEGSDWFWWYGADQDSGDDGYFDAAYRELLGGVYDALGMERPVYVGVPIRTEPPVTPTRSPEGLVEVTVDNTIDAGEWAPAGRYDVPDAATMRAVHYGFATDRMLFRIDFAGEVLGNHDAALDLYLGVPGALQTRAAGVQGTPLGFPASAMVRWVGTEPTRVRLAPELPDVESGDVAFAADPLPAGFDGTSIEFAVPLEALGAFQTGDAVLFRIVERTLVDVFGTVPAAGPAVAQVPDITEIDVALEVADPAGDDHGPGSYVYPTDGVFVPGSYDLTAFTVGRSGDDLVFTFDVAAAVQNPWGSPIGLSVQTFDVYIDQDPGAATGSRALLGGRNAALGPDDGWEYALTVEGWESALVVARPDGTLVETTPTLRIIVLGDRGRVIARVPAELLGAGDPAQWGYAVALLSQEGFPSSGVRRVRDVLPEAEQWRIGGAPADVNHTRILDLAWPEEGVQEEVLSTYPPITGTEPSVDEVATIPLLIAP